MVSSWRSWATRCGEHAGHNEVCPLATSGARLRIWATIRSLLLYGELKSLKRVWTNQKDEMIQLGTLEEFEKRLRREWSIETGIIEGVYTLDRGVTRTLIVKGIDAAFIPHGATNRDPELVGRIIQDHYEALEGMFAFVGGQRQLSTSYLKELHAALLRNQETYTVVINSAKRSRSGSKRACTRMPPIIPLGRMGLCTSIVPLSILHPRWTSY
jgi:hypothetical protein